MRCCEWMQLATTCTIVSLWCIGFVDGHVCHGSCKNNQYCDSGTRSCESCAIFCEPDISQFANKLDCNEKCPYVIYGTSQTRACPFACEPGYVCVKYLQSCESCEIFCNPEYQYAEKCPESCSVASSSLSPSPPPESGVTTKRDVTTTDKQTLSPVKTTPAPKNTDGNRKNIIIISVSVTVGFFCVIALIYLIIGLRKKYCGKQTHFPIPAETDPMAESNAQEPVFV